MVDLLVVLQSHSVTNNQKQLTRYMSNDKAEISYRCIKSLIHSLNWCKQEAGTNVNIRFKIFDDHSDVDFLNKLNIFFSFLFS